MFSDLNSRLEVSVRMLDGATLRGSLLKSSDNPKIEAILSKESPFLEFLSKDGQRKFLSKHQIAYVEPVEPLRKPVLANTNDPNFVDGYAMLGLQKSCTFDDAKQAYHAKAKMYHPDNYSGANLPLEVERYLNKMFQQINTAFTEVKSELQETNPQPAFAG